MNDDVRKILTKLLNIVTLGVVDNRASDGTYQVLHTGDRASAGVEHLEPQGVHFRAPAEAQGVLLSPGGNKSASVMLNASGPAPGGSVAAGEGGLHYLGTFKIWLDQDGTLHLGQPDPTDYVALASLVDTRFLDLLTALTNATITPADGGASLKAGILASLATAGWALPVGAPSVASTNVKCS